MIELEPARFDDQAHGCGAPANQTELREGPLAAAAQLCPDRILRIAQDADEDVVDCRMLAAGRARVQFGKLERALNEHGLPQRRQARPTAAPPVPTGHATRRFVDRFATERTVQPSDHLVDVNAETPQHVAATVAAEHDPLLFQSTEFRFDSLRGKAARTQDTHRRGVACS